MGPTQRTLVLMFSVGLATMSLAPFACAVDGGYGADGPNVSPIRPSAPGVGRLAEPDTDEDQPDPSTSQPYRGFGAGIVPNRRGGERPNTYGTVIGPGGIIPPAPPVPRRVEVPKKPALTPQERAAAIRKALTPKPPLAVARRHTLDDLYGKLAAAGDADEAKGLATLIANIWMRSGSDTASLLMQRAGEAQAKRDYPVAIDILDKIVALQPNWAEAWNRRATVRFLAGDLDGSMADVEHVLKLEPKHFGALQGMAMILQRTGLDKQALEVYRRVLSIYPHQPELKDEVDKLELRVEGQGI